MFCKNCGKEIDNNAVVCVHCGSKTDNFSSVEEKKKNVLGIAGFVCSIISIWLGAFFCILPLTALGLSIGGMLKSKNYNSCNGLTLAGLIISILTTAIWLIYWVVEFIIMAHA